MPTTFVPPFDKGENDTLKAARALGFTEYCAAFQDFNTNEDYRQGIKVEAVSLVFANESLQSMKDKTEQFLDDAHSIDTFVVLYHPADFSGPNGAVNAERVKVLAIKSIIYRARDACSSPSLTVCGQRRATALAVPRPAVTLLRKRPPLRITCRTAF